MLPGAGKIRELLGGVGDGTEMENWVLQNVGISLLDEKILASGEGLCSVEFSFIFSTFDSRANEGISMLFMRVIFFSAANIPLEEKR